MGQKRRDTMGDGAANPANDLTDAKRQIPRTTSSLEKLRNVKKLSKREVPQTAERRKKNEKCQ
jgi:hypothetical protein